MQAELEEILSLQREYSPSKNPAMERRGALVRRGAVHWLRDRLDALTRVMPEMATDLSVQGKDALGQYSEIPWIRVYSKSRSPKASVGWYVVYLFSADGTRVYLSLNQGTTTWLNGVNRNQPPEILTARVAWARSILTDQISDLPGSLQVIDLAVRVSKVGKSYQLGNVVALEYKSGSVSASESLEADLLRMTRILGDLYKAEENGLGIPGELASEIADAEAMVDHIAHPRRRGRGYRLSADERRTIEMHAVGVAREYLHNEGYHTEDVGAICSYDVDARRDEHRIFVEVKGTTSLGEEVVLTKAEVELHELEYPNTMLIVVHSIALQRGRSPSASGGTLRVMPAWRPERVDLTPMSYRYAVPAASSAPRTSPTHSAR